MLQLKKFGRRGYEKRTTSGQRRVTSDAFGAPFDPVITTTGSGRCTLLALPAILALVMGTTAALAAGPFADHVENYTTGSDLSPGYQDPQVALGSPSRFTPDTYPSAVTMVNPPYLSSQIVQLGAGGSLTVKFDDPIANDPAHPYGADLIVFSNSMFLFDFNNWTISNANSLYGHNTGRVEISSDGVNFYEIPNVLAGGLFPTQGYLDTTGPWDGSPGEVLADFRKPVNPALTAASFNGLTMTQAIALYDGSGGGAALDIANAIDAEGHLAGLSSVSYVRVTNVGDDPMYLDGFAAVPEPMTALLLPLLLGLGLRRSRR